MKIHSEETIDNEFVIRGGGDSFLTKQKEMFEQLSEAAKKLDKYHSASSLSETEKRIISDCPKKCSGSRSLIKRNFNEMMQYRGKESIFKNPEAPTPFKVWKGIFEPRRNPKKWVKYSLEDVRTEHMSDQSNAHAAFSFLRELRARKFLNASEQDPTEKRCVDSPETESSVTSLARCKFTTYIPFRSKSTSEETKKPSVVIVEHDDRPVFRNSKIILPEYVVGQKREKKAKTVRSPVKFDTAKQLKLDHLQEEIDE